MLQSVSDQDSGYGEAVEPRPSLWRLVEESVPRSERPEIRRILGEAAVGLSLELHAEVETLLELWREIRSAGFSPHQNPVSSIWSVLADPPVIKDMVREEIRMLLFSVRQKARREGRDEKQAVAKYNPSVVSFVMGTGRPGSGVGRPASTRGRIGGQEVPSRPQTASCSNIYGGDERSASSLSAGSSLGDDLKDMKEKLNVSDIDEVVAHLQSVLEEECRTLEKDIAFLQTCLEEEHCYATELMAPTPEPTLAELKEERRAIERDLQRGQSAPTPLQSHKTLLQKPRGHSSRPPESIARIPAKTEKCAEPSTTPSAVSISNNRTSLCPPGSKVRSQTHNRLNSTARTPIITDDCGHLSNVTHPKPSPPGTAKLRSEPDMTELGHLQLGDQEHRYSNMPNIDSKVSTSLEKCMMQLPPGQLGVLTMSSLPYLKARLSHVKQTSSGSNLLKSESLKNSAVTDLGVVFIPAPPSDHRPVGKSALSSTSAASSNRRVKMLQSNQTILLSETAHHSTQ